MIFTLIRGFVILFIAVVITYFFSFIEKIPGSIVVEIKDKELKLNDDEKNIVDQAMPIYESLYKFVI